MKLSKETFVRILGLAGLWTQLDQGSVAMLHALPHMPSIEIGYSLTKHQHRIQLTGLKHENSHYAQPFKMDIEMKDGFVEIISMHDQGEAVDLANTDVVNRVLGKLALQISYVHTLDAQNELENDVSTTMAMAA